MNRDTIWKAHHSGTTTWFLENNLFEQWKAEGSLLWVHGKSMFLSTTRLPFPLKGSWCRSWFREKHSSVRVIHMTDVGDF